MHCFSSGFWWRETLSSCNWFDIDWFTGRVYDTAAKSTGLLSTAFSYDVNVPFQSICPTPSAGQWCASHIAIMCDCFRKYTQSTQLRTASIFRCSPLDFSPVQPVHQTRRGQLHLGPSITVLRAIGWSSSWGLIHDLYRKSSPQSNQAPHIIITQQVRALVFSQPDDRNTFHCPRLVQGVIGIRLLKSRFGHDLLWCRRLREL